MQYTIVRVKEPCKHLENTLETVLNELQQEVSRYTAKGWEPQGNVIIKESPINYVVHVFAIQVMVKK